MRTWIGIVLAGAVLVTLPIGVAIKGATDVVGEVRDLCDGITAGDETGKALQEAEKRGLAVVPLDNGGYLFKKRNSGTIPLMAGCQVTVKEGRIATKEHFVD